jgi:Xaa-Pro dipeptidase
VLLALTPENAAYLAGRSSYIASLWRVPGLFACAMGRDGARAVAIDDFEAASFAGDGLAHLATYPIWTDAADLTGTDSRLDVAAALRHVRPTQPAPRPAQYDLDDVSRAVDAAVRAVVRSPNRVGVELSTLPLAAVELLAGQLKDTELIDVTAILDDLRAVKDEHEIGLLRLACELTEVGIGAARDRLAVGMSDLAVNAAYQTAIWERAAAEPRFAAHRQVEGVATVGSGLPEERVVAPGRTVKFDMQVDVGGYHSDIGRTYALIPTDQQRAVHAALRTALAVAEAVVRPGTPIEAVYWAGLNAMRAAGFESYNRGHLGHSVGLAHNYEEPPFIAAGEDRPLVDGMVLSLELPFYLRGVGAFQLERMILVTNDDCEAIDRLPFDLAIG